MLQKKICVISFDHWNYDHHIIPALEKRGIQSYHINIGSFKHRNFWERLKNTFSKVFLKKNIKNINRHQFILNTLTKIGKQDQILVINPELISKQCHLKIKTHTSRYLAYLYDSVARCPIEHLLDNVFDAIYSFDENDVEKYHFIKTSNYIYNKKQEIVSLDAIKFQSFYLASHDERLPFLYKIRKKLDTIGITYHFIIVGKKGFFNKFLSIILTNKKSSVIKFKKNRIQQKNISKYYNQAYVIIDLVRKNQTGLSFRVFESLAFQKKIITSNQSIVNYPFYNPNNILIIDENEVAIDKNFFLTPYEPIPEEIYNEYTIDSWVDKVFRLGSND